MAITVTIGGFIQVTDSVSGTVALQKALSSLVMTGTAFTEAQTLSLGTSPTSISLPVSPANFLYIKNLHASNTVTVTWTPNGGSSAAIQTLEPGGALIFTQGTSGAGITALSVVASGSTTPIEFILAG